MKYLVFRCYDNNWTLLHSSDDKAEAEQVTRWLNGYERFGVFHTFESI